ncbi:hypothetical protein QO002_001072 [Pararhizobium capsulatum DSM 1112]|uniref:Uncharacterized protein n=1 Tax=Pararhizobium capsulatum DSM 1112 TaxID=1121113 RepID=A0ABU0BL18_9HYPH|nr:hypothetical protein [Pararhizobium capsulatum]MDQ0318934.1 hypothetical protein [Pararhizobium capsulatum DSM 1112]
MSRTEEIIERVRATVAQSKALRQRALIYRANARQLTEPATDRNGQFHFVFSMENDETIRH